jgi:uncharacterized membrane protein
MAGKKKKKRGKRARAREARPAASRAAKPKPVRTESAPVAATPPARAIGGAEAHPRYLLWAVLGLAALYTLLMSYFALVQHFNLRTQMADLGNNAQAMWSFTQGDLRLTISNDDLGVFRSAMGIHVNLFFYPIAVLYSIYPHPETLPVLASAACAAAGLGLFTLARLKLGNTWWVLVPPAAYWLSPIVHETNLYDFKVLTFAAAFVVWAVWALETNRKVLAWVLLGCAMLCKEDIPLITFMIGVWLALTGRRKMGMQVIAASIGYLLVAMMVIVPLFEQGRDLTLVTGLASRHKWLGSSVGEMLLFIISHPIKVIGHALQFHHLRILLYLLIGGGLAALKAWRILLLAAPSLGIGMLSQGAWMTRITGVYYWIVPEAVVVMGCIFAASMARLPGRRPWQLIYLGGATLVLSVILTPLPYGSFIHPGNYAPVPAAKLLPEIAKLIPDDGRLCIQNNLGPHFLDRRDITCQDNRCEGADYHLYHLRYVGGPDAGLFARTSVTLFGRTERLTRRFNKILSSPEWGLVYQKEGFYLFKKGEEGIVSQQEARQRFRKDWSIFLKQYAEARKHRTPLMRYLVGIPR